MTDTMGMDFEIEGQVHAKRACVCVQYVSLIGTGWLVVSMAAPQHWLIKDTEQSDSGKFMLISVPVCSTTLLRHY